jgi:SOUL heme-binding protein
MEKFRMATILSNVLLGACSVFGIRSGTEEPPYQVLDHVGTVEIRQYDARTAAETTVSNDEVAARSDGFRKLAKYIFGGNTGQQSIPMTAPVAQDEITMTTPVAQTSSGGSQWTIRFYLPAGMTETAAPKPLDPSVRIVSVPPDSMAVLRFSGSPTPEAVASEGAQLILALRGSSWVEEGYPVAWFYDPPWTLPPLRRNEVAVEVRRQPG